MNLIILNIIEQFLFIFPQLCAGRDRGYVCAQVVGKENAEKVTAASDEALVPPLHARLAMAFPSNVPVAIKPLQPFFLRELITRHTRRWCPPPFFSLLYYSNAYS
jgi:hypothetical protein